MPVDPPAAFDAEAFDARLRALEQLFSQLYDPSNAPFTTPSAPPSSGNFQRPSGA
jgi:hypothetical protein